MEKLAEFAKKAVAQAIEAGIIQADDQEARRAIAGLAVAMYSQEDPEALRQDVADSLYAELNS